MNGVLFPIGPCVLALVAIASAWDWQTRRIPNWLVASALTVALPMQWALHGALSGTQIWFTGCIAGGMLLLPGYLLRALGAGDVKLMAAVGSLCGATLAVEVAMIAWIVGGLWALGTLVYRRQLRTGLSTTFSLVLTVVGRAHQAGGDQPQAPARETTGAPSLGRLPFGVAIAIGTVIAVMTTH
jgi:prepilin peptidase CpaA